MTAICLFTNQPFFASSLEEIFSQIPSIYLSINPEIADGDVILCANEPLAAFDLSLNPRNLPVVYLGQGPEGSDFLLLPLDINDLIKRVQKEKNNFSNAKQWSLGSIYYHPRPKTLTLSETKIFLTDSEVDILNHLCENPDGSTRNTLQTSCLKYSSQAQTHTIETHLYRLRKKLTMLSGEDWIIFDDSTGYRLKIKPRLLLAAVDPQN
jgi:DNA-binding winged helix-turn-helix (wHTH) protein